MSIDLMPGFGAFTPASSGPLTGSESDGTNTLTGAAGFEFPPWFTSNSLTTADAILAPDGATDGLLVYGNGGSARHIIAYEIASTGTGNRTASVYVKEGTLRYAKITTSATDAAFVYVDAQTGTITDTETGTDTVLSSSSIAAGANGWWKVTMNYSITTGTTGYFVFALSDRSTHGGTLDLDDPSFTTGDGLYFWRPKVVNV